jgi:hypothetical protein
MPHGTTQKQPSAEWKMEKTYLKPYQKMSLKGEERMVYTVRKDRAASPFAATSIRFLWVPTGARDPKWS